MASRSVCATLAPVCRRSTGAAFSIPSSRRVPAETGLGLAVVKQVVEAHGGTIVLAETGDASTGACFEIQLPASDAARSAA